MTAFDRSLWEAVKANRRAVEACKRHSFAPNGPILLGRGLVCQACNGSMQLTEIGSYIRGYEAAGASADDIWPGYRKEKQR
jgi:hypothetical protein